MQFINYGPVVTPTHIPKNIDGSNINGPTVFKTPKFLRGVCRHDYTMLFAHHGGLGIRIAGSSSPVGSWEVYNQNFIHVENTPCHGHIASPDVVLHKDRLDLYYHGVTSEGQKTFICSTFNGKEFAFNRYSVGHFYWRNFFWRNDHWAIARTPLDGAILYRRQGPLFGVCGMFLREMRHCCVDLDMDQVFLYWSQVGDAPERIYRAAFDPLTLQLDAAEEVCRPTEPWQGSLRPLAPSNFGAANNVNQLRDPFLFRDAGKQYLFYTYKGEDGIAVGEIC